MTKTVADSPVAFADLGLAPEVLAALADVGYESPSPIQAATIRSTAERLTSSFL